MSNVFISYSRKDIAFTRLLQKALEEEDIKTWVDWQDIPPSTEWLKEIFDAIEKAEVFIFVMSRSSSESQICRLEIEHAIINNKRIIPVAIEDVTPNQLLPQLASINWLSCRDNDKLSQVFQNLLSAIHIDYDWVKAHTRLQLRALDWKKNGREIGYLLEGRDLVESEQWLNWALTENLEPQPTKLQKEFIQSGNKNLIRRKRIATVLTVLSVMVIAVSAFSYFYIQTNISRQKEEANLFAELVRAAQIGEVESLRAAIETRVELDNFDDTGLAPLHHAVIEKQTEAVKILLGAGAMVNLADIEGNTPLHYAVGKNNSEILLLLIEAGAVSDIWNIYGDTPLHKAARSGNAEAINSLIEAGAYIDARCGLLGQTALHMVAWLGYSDLARLLIDAGAEIDSTCYHFNWTPLHYTAKFGEREMAELLLQTGADMYVLDKDGKTPFDLAESENQTEILDLLKQYGGANNY